MVGSRHVRCSVHGCRYYLTIEADILPNLPRVVLLPKEAALGVENERVGSGGGFVGF